MKLPAGWGLGMQGLTSPWPRGEHRRLNISAAETGAVPTTKAKVRDDARHKTCTALCLEARLRRHARGQRAHAVQSLPALLRLRVSSALPGLSQHKTHLGRILFPPRVITGPAKSHLLFAVTGLTALLLLQFDCNRGLFTGFDGRGGVFPIYAQGKEVLGTITKDWYPLPKIKGQLSCHPR